MSDPYGNYAITEIISNWDNETCQTIYTQLVNKLSELSIQKYSSNVIERCLEFADKTTRSIYIGELRRSERLHYVMKSSYGNYVVQKALKISEGTDREELMAAISANTPLI